MKQLTRRSLVYDNLLSTNIMEEQKTKTVDFTEEDKLVFDFVQKLSSESDSNCSISLMYPQPDSSGSIGFDVECNISPSDEFNEMHLYVLVQRDTDVQSMYSEFLSGLKNKIVELGDEKKFDSHAFDYLSDIEDQNEFDEHYNSLKANNKLIVSHYDSFYNHLKKSLLGLGLNHKRLQNPDVSKNFIIANGTLIKYVGHDSNVVIPDGIHTIADGAFRQEVEIEWVKFPASVKTIGDNAFAYCEGLTRVFFDDCPERSKLETIGKNAFFGCNNLQCPILPESLKVIDNNAFAYCNSFQLMCLPENLEKIGAHAFSCCYKLASVHSSYDYGINRSCDLVHLNEIGECAFMGCISLKQVKLGSTQLKTIKENTFKNCLNLGRVILDDSLKSEKVCLDDNVENLVLGVHLGNNIENIEKNAFFNCYGLTKAFLGENLKTLGEAAFSRCTGLKTVEIPSTVEESIKSAFSCCGEVKFTIHKTEQAEEQNVDSKKVEFKKEPLVPSHKQQSRKV